VTTEFKGLIKLVTTENFCNVACYQTRGLLLRICVTSGVRISSESHITKFAPTSKHLNEMRGGG
jgi:hypothetical protein